MNTVFDRGAWESGYPFELDRFQREALDAFDAHEHVLVAAPTSSGKTVVAEYGIGAVIATGGRAFYTTPIKALSNQKYADLVARHGEERVGLLTGDNSINAGAAIVVMTTEVLRNMIYTNSTALDRLALVVLDEVHYLQDTYRGPVWEEVLIHAPPHVRFICLSATVSNVDDLAEWIETVRGPTTAVVERQRPVRLASHYLVADRTDERLRFMPVLVGGQPNRDAVKLDEAAFRRAGPGRPRARRERVDTRGAQRRQLATPGRVETVELLDDRDLLPAIYFIFSRNGCDDAAEACRDADLLLTDAGERDRIDAIVDEHLRSLGADDLDVLGAERFRAQLRAGFAPHHAGMVPSMKEAVEACFVAGLVKVVFATETLALGINMPARSVVIEKLTKFTGDRHEQLTPAEYTQLTGRAGRRGIDDFGDAVVLWSPWVRFDEVARLVSSSSFHLRSAFRTTYNMAANLVSRYARDQAARLLNMSFAQFQADRDVVRLERRLVRREERHRELRAAALSEFGDIDEYRRQRAAERAAADQLRSSRRAAVTATIETLTPGAVIGGRYRGKRGPFVVLAVAQRKAGLKVSLLDRGGDVLSVSEAEFAEAPQVLGTVQLPPGFAARQRDDRNTVAFRLRRLKLAKSSGTAPGDRPDGDTGPRAATMHPVEHDPDLQRRLRAAAQADRVAQEITDLRRRIGSKHHSLSEEFDRVLTILSRFGYVDDEAWTLTDDGLVLARLFHECDLLVAEVLRLGLLDGLRPAEVAALVSTFVYEHRSPDPAPTPWFPSAQVRRRWDSIAALSADLQAIERSVGLPPHRAPDPTFAAVAYAWVAGEPFADVVRDEELTGGDFVRTTRQLVDLLSQIAIVAASTDTRGAAQSAADAARRGVVADSAGATSGERSQRGRLLGESDDDDQTR